MFVSSSWLPVGVYLIAKYSQEWEECFDVLLQYEGTVTLKDNRVRLSTVINPIPLVHSIDEFSFPHSSLLSICSRDLLLSILLLNIRMLSPSRNSSRQCLSLCLSPQILSPSRFRYLIHHFPPLSSSLDQCSRHVDLNSTTDSGMTPFHLAMG
jgi:hypothetical protein